ncbi:MAG: mechanosensitive ion channel domain-containing protein, partial [Myxococcota bacterium]
VAVIAFVALKWLIFPLIYKAIGGVNETWGERLRRFRVLDPFAHLAWIMVVVSGVDVVPDLSKPSLALLSRFGLVFVIFFSFNVSARFLRAIQDGYSSSDYKAAQFIGAYLQLARIFLWLVAGILIVAVLAGRSPLLMLSGIGAVSAVLLLVFRDTLNSMVAGVVIHQNGLFDVGDWIEIPSHNANGDVVDISLYSVRIRNFDNTTAVIPTYSLIQESFINWQGMFDRGGRRIKRSLYVDVNTVRFLDQDEIGRFSEYELLGDYFQRKLSEIHAYNNEEGRNTAIGADLRRLTNVGTYRAYIEAYLGAHPKLCDDMTLMVRQLDMGEMGLPLQIYCYVSDTRWVQYETIQADIFDHLIALAPEFGLRIFQVESDYQGGAGPARKLPVAPVRQSPEAE